MSAGEPLPDQNDFELHLVPADDFDIELILPCDQPIVLPHGRYGFWVEGKDLISGLATLWAVNPSDVPEQLRAQLNSHKLVVTVKPAGTIHISGSARLTDSEQLRLINLGSHQAGDVLGNEFWRRVPADRATKGVQMPVGRVVAAVYDTAIKRYTKLAGPVTISPASDVATVPRSPEKGRAALIVRIERPSRAEHLAGNRVGCSIDIPGLGTVEPDVLIPSLGRVYAIWKDLPPGEASLSVDAEQFWIEQQTLGLNPGQITDVLLEPTRRPELSVEFNLPASSAEFGGRLLVAETGRTGSIRQLDLAQPFTTGVLIERLPPRELTVDLLLGPWSFRKTVDLRAGVDEAVLFSPEAIHVTGEVRRGEQPIEARIRFLTSRSIRQDAHYLEVATDEAGQFEAVLFAGEIGPAVYILPHDEGWSHVTRLLEKEPRDGDNLEFVLPTTRVIIEVMNGSTQEPVAHAIVEHRVQESTGRELVSVTRTDGQGLAKLFGVQNGTLRLTAHAEGFRPSKLLDIAIDGEDEELTLTIQLEPEAEGASVAVLLPGGKPAPGADVALFSSSLGGIAWLGRTSGDGRVSVPPDVQGRVLVARHSAAGFRLVEWRGRQEGEFTIELPRPAGPVAVHTVQPGGEPAPFCSIAMWADGVKLSGGLLAWLTRTPAAASDIEGFWRPSFLPQGNIAILAWPSAERELWREVLTGNLDYRRTGFSVPMAAVLEVEAVVP